MGNRFRVLYMPEASGFLRTLEPKVQSKILFNIDRALIRLDPMLFKKLNRDIWEFRTAYGGNQYRLLAFWDKRTKLDTLVIATHGFMKKTDKVPGKEIQRAETAMNLYFKTT